MKILNNKYISFITNLLIPLILGIIVGIFSGSSAGYTEFIKPSFAPPKIVFPIVWTILYLLMGLSAYIISQSNALNKNKALNIYYLQLLFNLIWSFIFFKFKLLLLAVIWIIILIILVIKMIIEFKKINSLSAYLQIPYLVWLIFALFLNFSILIINY